MLVENIEGQNSLTTVVRHFEGFLLAPHAATLMKPVRHHPLHAATCPLLLNLPTLHLAAAAAYSCTSSGLCLLRPAQDVRVGTNPLP